MPENQTVWKSDNQGFKEAIFIQIQMVRRGWRQGAEAERIQYGST